VKHANPYPTRLDRLRWRRWWTSHALRKSGTPLDSAVSAWVALVAWSQPILDPSPANLLFFLQPHQPLLFDLSILNTFFPLFTALVFNHLPLHRPILSSLHPLTNIIELYPRSPPAPAPGLSFVVSWPAIGHPLRTPSTQPPSFESLQYNSQNVVLLWIAASSAITLVSFRFIT